VASSLYRDYASKVLTLSSISGIAQVAADLAQVAAVVVGGFWAYWKFFRGRTFRYRAELSVSGEFLTLGNAGALRITADLRNTGLSRIPLLPGEKVVLVDWLVSDQLELSDRAVYWGPLQGRRRVVIFEEHEGLEPGELISDSVLVPVPLPSEADGPLAFRVRMLVTTKKLSLRRGSQRRLWSANSVLQASRPNPGDEGGRDATRE